MSEPDGGDGDRSTDAPGGTAVSRRTFVAGASAAAAGSAIGTGTADAVATDGGTDDRSEGGGGDPAVIAHRGYAGLYPENTVGAVEASSAEGDADSVARQPADMIEIDVVPTADGDVVVFHDDRLAERDGGERGLTDASGVVWEEPTDVVTSAEVLESGETVPLLTEVMDAIPPSVGVNVEFKNPGSFDLEFDAKLSGDALEAQKDVWRPFTEGVLAVVEDYENDILVSSFYEAAIATVRERSGIPVAPLLWNGIEDGLAIAREYDAEAIHPPYNMIEGTPFFADPVYTDTVMWEDIDLLSVAHDEGRDVNAFTVQTWYEAEQLAAAGVDGIIADYPGLLGFVQ
ncbi:glycerophosphodiester phosphodiesterase [Halostella sp. JP-L12]|uniref:glycerophosphodiester phosphodiesterase n=1 Tax=Halostella TaxID=1843185 RepID=UPI000EF7A3A5|nr:MULTISPECIES: glycerophosphodiester phosphodiesterase [Halostella]NHN49494.1 glycerophosphodiester phosphodiesterase [Halostella sp. JP-L12]